jgi:hypothetical protein
MDDAVVDEEVLAEALAGGVHAGERSVVSSEWSG